MHSLFAIPYVTILPSDSHSVSEEEIMAIMGKASKELCLRDSLMYGIILKETLIASWFTNFYEVKYAIKYGQQQQDDLCKIQKRITSQLIYLSNQEIINDNDENIAAMEQGSFDVKLGKGSEKRIYKISYKIIKNTESESLLFLDQYIQKINNVLNDPT